jgi:hypothetical protein
MTRVFLTIVLPVLLPTALYLLWAMSVGRAGPDTPAAAWRALPWTWLAVSGVALAMVVLGVVVETGGTRDGTYVAPHVVNGRIVPGHVVAPGGPP